MPAFAHVLRGAGLCLALTSAALADEPPAATTTGSVEEARRLAEICRHSVEGTVEVKPVPSPWRAPALVVEGQFALAGPLGGLGAALDLSVTPWLAINAGIGLAPTNTDTKVQYALTPRVRIPLGHFALGWETGLSGGGHSETFACVLMDSTESKHCLPYHWSQALWVNTNLSLELQEEHIHLRAFVGRGTPLAARGEAYCEPKNSGKDCIEAPSRLPSAVANLGFAIGYVF